MAKLPATSLAGVVGMRYSTCVTVKIMRTPFHQPSKPQRHSKPAGNGTETLFGMRAVPVPSAKPGPARAFGTCACGGQCPRCQTAAALRISSPADSAEREADRVAEAIMRAPATLTADTAARSSGMGEARALQRQEQPSSPGAIADPPATVLDEDFDRRLDWFEMSRPFTTRGVEGQLLGDTRTYFSIGHLWQHNYQFFFNVGLGDGLSADAANFFTPFAVDSALKHDFPTQGELFERDADISSFIVSPTLFRFDVDAIPSTLRSPLSFLFGGDSGNPYRKKPRHTLGRKAEASGEPGTLDAGARHSVDGTLRASGAPLSGDTLSFYSARFGRDFSAVRVHADAQAAQSARAVGARAYTVGHDIVFAGGQYQPHTDDGRRLLAHELAHVVQQTDPPIQQTQEATLAPAVAPVGQHHLQREPGEGETDFTMLPDPAIEGQEFVAQRCGTSLGCDLKFRFLEAATGKFRATETLLGGAYWRGARVQIAASITPACGPCESLELVQVVQFLGKGEYGLTENTRPIDDTYARRAGYGGSESEQRSPGFAIDAHATSREPVYTRGAYGEPGTTTTPAMMLDQPGSYSSQRDAGKRFYTYAVCVNGSHSVPLGYVVWGYWIDHDGKVSFSPTRPWAFCGALQSLQDAADRWNTFGDLTPINLDVPPPFLE